MIKLQFTLITSEYRGDHAADIRIAIEPRDGETIDAMLERILRKNHCDHIEARAVVTLEDVRR